MHTLSRCCVGAGGAEGVCMMAGIALQAVNDGVAHGCVVVHDGQALLGERHRIFKNWEKIIYLFIILCLTKISSNCEPVIFSYGM